MYRALIVLLLALSMAACGGGGNSTPAPPPPAAFSITPTSSTVAVSQDGTHSSVHVAVSRTTATALTVSEIGLPNAVTMTATGGASNDQVLDFQVTSLSTPSAGTFPVAVFVSDGTSSAKTTLAVTVTVSSSVQAVSTKHSDIFMSTSFQPAEWDYTYFQTNTAARKQTLDNLGSKHINLQPVSGANAKLDPSSAGALDFSVMDAIVQPVLQSADGSPLFQVVAPTWMWVNGNSANALNDMTFNQFADYAAMLVRYYNVPGGFTHNGVTYASPAGKPITWWGIFNEPNLTSLTPQQYVQLYNVTAAKMLAVDPTIKLVAVELSDWGNEPQRYLPAFVSGVTQPVDALATHYYGGCNQRDTDQQVMDSVKVFHDHVVYFRQQMNLNPSLAALPVWVTENNVNADYNNNGKSNCNPSQTFVADARGSSAYFAAWRPYVFSQLVSAGADSLHHWDYNADTQYGEVDFNTGNTYISYWVDYWLTRYMTDPLGVDVLPLTSTQTFGVETMAVRRPDASIVVMVSNHLVLGSSDNNGAGSPLTITVDTSSLGTFKSATLMTIDAKTSASTGPTAATVTPAVKMPITFTGYGVAFLQLIP